MVLDPDKTILIVDDHPSIRMALKIMLEKESGMRVVAEAADGESGLRLIKELDPNLVVLDLILPGIDGLNLISQIRLRNLSSKVVVFSSQDSRIYSQRVAEAGGNGFVSKSLTPEQIIAAFKMIIAGYNCFPEIEMTGRRSLALEEDPLQRVSKRELIVLLALVRGAGPREIAQDMHISEKTVSTYKRSILAKLGLTSMVDLVNFARTHGLISKD